MDILSDVNLGTGISSDPHGKLSESPPIRYEEYQTGPADHLSSRPIPCRVSTFSAHMLVWDPRLCGRCDLNVDRHVEAKPRQLVIAASGDARFGYGLMCRVLA